MKELWITNISKCDIHLSDLNIVLKSMKSTNLFGHTTIKKEDVIKSCLSGSIFKRKGVLFIRFNAPKKEPKKIEKINNVLNNRSKSIVNIIKKEIPEIQELHSTDEDEEIIKELLNGEE